MSKWVQYKQNPHIKYNPSSRKYRCATCKIELNRNPGGAGKHSTKIHNVTLAGKPVPKVIKKKKDEVTTKDIVNALNSYLPKVTKNMKNMSEQLETVEEKMIRLVKFQNGIWDEVIEVQSKQDELSKKFKNLEKENKKVIDFVRSYVTIKGLKEGGFLK